MKPLISQTQDAAALVELGRASVQVVHDLKNQINGLKLYATFLRKRFEKAERPPDELETIGKLIAGLERAANDTAALVRYGRPLELRRAPRTDLARLVVAAAPEGASVHVADGSYNGDFDASALTEAFKNITAATATAAATGLHLRRETEAGVASAVVEWSGIAAAASSNGDADVFNSFAGVHGIRLALAAKIVRAHGGEATQEADHVRVRLPLEE